MPPEILASFGDEVAALRSEGAAAAAAAALAAPASTEDGTSFAGEAPINVEPERAENEAIAEVQPPKQEEEELPQTQMAAAFAAINMDQLASDTPPEETKA